MPKTVYLLSKAGTGNEERTFFNRAGVAFDANKDGSVNFKLDMYPSLTFQIREPKFDEKKEANRGRRK